MKLFENCTVWIGLHICGKIKWALANILPTLSITRYNQYDIHHSRYFKNKFVYRVFDILKHNAQPNIWETDSVSEALCSLVFFIIRDDGQSPRTQQFRVISKNPLESINIYFLCESQSKVRDSASRFSKRLRAGRPRDRSPSPSLGKMFLLSTSSRPVLGPTHPPI
jgi:hypothetical protein